MRVNQATLTQLLLVLWPNLPWTGNLKSDKSVAESPYYRHLHTDSCAKTGSWFQNYGGKPQTLAEQAKVELDLVRQFQPKYRSLPSPPTLADPRRRNPPQEKAILSRS